MELRVLRYFLAVAREETIIGAADSLHLTQPTLSRQMMELEQELGKKLFIRGNRRITLTEEGMFLRKRAQEIVDLADKTEQDFRLGEEIITGEVFLGAGETEGFRTIARAIKRMQVLCPLVKFHTFSGNAEAVTQRLDRGLIDFGLVIEPLELKKYDYMRLHVSDVWGLLMKREDPLAQKDGIEPKDLEGIPLLCSRQMLSENGLSGWLDKSQENYNVVLTYNLLYNAALMVEEGVGYALTIDRPVNTGEDNGLVFVPLKPRLKVSVDIIWKKYQVFSKAAMRFLQILQEENSPQESYSDI